MFLSGYLTGKSLFKISTLRDIGQFLKKRFQSLLLPYFVAGGVLYFFKGNFFVYWYLLVLFEFILICSIVRLGVTKLFNSRQDLISICLFALMAITLICVFPQIRPFHKAPFLDIEHFSLFPYFVLGLFSFRVSYEQKVLDKEWALFVFAVFTLLFYMGMTRGNFNEVGKAILQLSFVSSLILLIVSVFYRLQQDTRPLRCLQRLGNISLEIYILHFFFLFNNPIRWGLVAKIFESHMGGVTLLLIQMGTVLGETVFILFCCRIAMRLLSVSKTTYSLFLGRHIKMA